MMKRRLSSSDVETKMEIPDASGASAAASASADFVAVAREQLTELVQSVLSRDVLSSLVSQAVVSMAPKRFGNVSFGSGDESNVNAFLHQKLGKDNLSRRAGPRGTKLTYIESCKAIELANQAFGFNGWSCHILECKEEYREKKGERWCIGFSSLVRIELKDGTSHEDVGFGQADGQPHLGAAIEQAKKASISDARKRALRLFGEYLGNSCYDREHIKDVHSNKPQLSPAVAIPAPGGRSLGTSGPASTASSVVGPAGPLVNLPQQHPPANGQHFQQQQPQQQQQQQQQYQRPQPVMVATPSPPQQAPNASVANRIMALQAAEASRQAATMTSGVGGQSAAVGGGAVMRTMPPPLPQLTTVSHATPQASAASSSGTGARPLQTTAPLVQAPPQAAHNLPPRHQNQPPQPYMPRNAPPPSRLAEYPMIKTEPPRSMTSASEFDMNDLSLSQFDYDPSEDGPPGAAKRMRF